MRSITKLQTPHQKFSNDMWHAFYALITIYKWRCVHCLCMNVIWLFVLFKHGCCMFIHIVYTQKLCTSLLCLNNAWHSCSNDTKPEITNFASIWNEPMKFINLWCVFAYLFPILGEVTQLLAIEALDFGNILQFLFHRGSFVPRWVLIPLPLLTLFLGHL